MTLSLYVLIHAYVGLKLTCPGKKGHEVLIQGGVIDDVAKHLVEQFGIPKIYIEVLDKTRK